MDPCCTENRPDLKFDATILEPIHSQRQSKNFLIWISIFFWIYFLFILNVFFSAGDDKDSPSASPSSKFTRRKKPKRRSTGVVQLEMEDMDKQDSEDDSDTAAGEDHGTAKVRDWVKTR